MKSKNILAILISALIQPVIIEAQETALIERLLDNERFASAESLLQQKINTEGALPDLNYLIVKTYLQQDKADEAGAFIRKHNIGESPDAAPLNRAVYARYLLQQGKEEEANAVFNELAKNKKNRKNPPLLIVMAEALVREEKGNALQAINWLRMAAARDEGNAEIYLLLGQAYRKLGDASNAYQAYQQALKRNGRNKKAHFLLGKIFRAQRNPEVYLKHFQEAYSIDSTYAPVLEELYNHYYYTDTKLARTFLEKYIANSDYYIQNDYRITDMLYLTADYERAITSAKKIIQQEGNSAQARLYKLMAYSAMKKGDTSQAIKYVNEYFNKESPLKFIAPDFELRGNLTATLEGAEKEAASYYSIAAEMDTLAINKVRYATEIINLCKKLKDYHQEAIWHGKLYQWKEKTNNIDLFNWGLAHYSAAEYLEADSVFSLYTNQYPYDIYGYYWRAQSNAAIDTNLARGLAIPHYLKMIEIGEGDKEVNKKMLLKAYGYLGGYEANITKDYVKSLKWFERYLSLDSENKEVIGYTEMLKTWIKKE